MQIGLAMHSTEDLLEAYAFGRLPEEQTADIEEHLFVCEHCLARLAEIEGFLKVTKTAAAELRIGQTGRSGYRNLLSGRWWHIPKPVWAAGFAVLVLGLVIPFRPHPRPATQTELVQLVASRGSDAIAHARSSSSLLLGIEAGRLAPRPAYQIEVVSWDGAPVWKTHLASGGDQLTVLIRRPLAAGTYWVRVYGASELSRPLQEYQLDIR